MNRHSLPASICAFAAALVLISCGPSKREFGSLEPGPSSGSRHGSGLELPPDLVDSSSEVILADQANRQTQEILPEIENLSIERNDDEGWIEVNADAEFVWHKLVDHWSGLGIDLVQSDPTTGTMETDWVLPPGAKEEDKGMVDEVLGQLLGEVFDQATSLDKYVIQLERKEEARTRINVAHKGLRKIQTQKPTKQHNEEFEWVETDQEPGKVKRALTSIAYGLRDTS